MTDGKQRLRELLATVRTDPAERAMIDECVDRMSPSQADELVKKIAFADEATVFLIGEVDRLFGTAPVAEGT